jgi:hypothetical protein
MTSGKFVLLIAALVVGTPLSNPALARGGGGAANGSASNGGGSNGSSGLSATPTRPNPNSIFQNRFKNPITEGVPAAASTTSFNPNLGQFNQNANKTINTGTAPTNTGSAPSGGTSPPTNQNAGQTVGSQTTGSTQGAVAVGHAPNGLPIGSAGSGPGSPEHPIDSGSR